jgi:hypothetical protein
MTNAESEALVVLLMNELKLTPVATAGCIKNSGLAVSAILIAWNVVVKHCLPNEERWKLQNAPTDATLLQHIERIYSTNKPNWQFLDTLRTFYSVRPQERWKNSDFRALLDLAIRSAVESVFARSNEPAE